MTEKIKTLAISESIYNHFNNEKEKYKTTAEKLLSLLLQHADMKKIGEALKQEKEQKKKIDSQIFKIKHKK